MSSQCQVFAPWHILMRWIYSFAAVLILTAFATSAGAQTQASCQFVEFNRRLFLNSGHRFLNPEGINDHGTVVGDAYDDVDFTVRGFTRWPDGGITYFRRNNPETYFLDRSNRGVTVVVTGPAFSLGSGTATPFFLKDSTFTPFTITIGGQTYNGSFAPLNYRKKVTSNTELTGISNNSVIVGDHYGNAFLYSNGVFKDIVGPNGEQVTVRNISAGGSITGDIAMGGNGPHGFTATCQ